jgi:hypothetical protein
MAVANSGRCIVREAAGARRGRPSPGLARKFGAGRKFRRRFLYTGVPFSTELPPYQPPGAAEIAPEKVAEARAAAQKKQRIEVKPEASGNSSLAARELAPQTAAQMDQQLSARARELKKAGVGDSIGERRVLALLELFGLAGELASHGAVDPKLARQIADAILADPSSTITIMITNDEGQLVGQGRARRATNAERKQILQRGNPGQPRGPDPPGSEGDDQPGDQPHPIPSGRTRTNN